MGRLFWKFFFFTMLAQVVATISVGGTFWLKEMESHQHTAQIDLSPPASVKIDAAVLTLQYGGITALSKLLGKMDQRHQILAVDDRNRDLLGRPVNQQILAAARAMLYSDIQRREVQQATAQNGAHFLLFALEAGSEGNSLDDPGARPMPLSGGPDHGGGPVQPFQPFFGIATAILASLIFAWLLARYFSKPIQSLRLAFEAIANGNLNTRLGSEMGLRSDELADLGRDFDAMAERLRTLVDGQRRMMHDVSHELRSPLTRLQVAIGLARQQPEKMESSLIRIERESARMEKLVSELLTLARLESSEHLLVRNEIDLADLLANVIDDAKFEAEANDRSLEFTGNCSVCILGDLELLHRAIENVIRNAIKYTASGTAVIVEAQFAATSNEILLSVMDFGPGVPQAELQVIFEPFFRGASMLRNLDGHGLGLAIAIRVVNYHGGRIVARNRIGGGLCVEISLPVNTVRP